MAWQITPRVLMDALAVGGAKAKRAFATMIDMGKIDLAKSRLPGGGDGNQGCWGSTERSD